MKPLLPSPLKLTGITIGLVLISSCDALGKGDIDVGRRDPGRVESGESRLLSPAAPLSFARPRLAGAEAIDQERAFELAHAGLRYFWSMMKTNFERTHGAGLELESLVAQDHILVAHTPYVFVDPGLPGHIRRLLGSYYLVTFTTREGVPAVLIAVSVHATNADLLGGQLVLPEVYGNEFRMGGLSEDIDPDSSEVLELVGSEIGVPVRGTPVLITAGYQVLPHRGNWRVPLEREVDFVSRKDGSTRRSSVVYVTSAKQLALPASHGRRMDSISFGDGAGRRGVFRALVHPELAIDLVPVTPRFR